MNSYIWSKLIKNKAEQFKFIGLSSTEEKCVQDILNFAITSVSKNSNIQNFPYWKFMNNSYTPNISSVYHAFPCTVIYSIRDPYVINYSCNFDTIKYLVERELPESSLALSKNPFFSSDELLNTSASSQNGLSLGTKIELLRKVLEGISEENELLIWAKPKNKSTKLRKSNRHSRFRGVSLNGKKWQVMIMGIQSKKYFGAINTEREAAIFYDKLSILTNGLAAKTNFNYRKCDLQKIMAELESMEYLVSK